MLQTFLQRKREAMQIFLAMIAHQRDSKPRTALRHRGWTHRRYPKTPLLQKMCKGQSSLRCAHLHGNNRTHRMKSSMSRNFLQGLRKKFNALPQLFSTPSFFLHKTHSRLHRTRQGRRQDNRLAAIPHTGVGRHTQQRFVGSQYAR